MSAGVLLTLILGGWIALSVVVAPLVGGALRRAGEPPEPLTQRRTAADLNIGEKAAR